MDDTQAVPLGETLSVMGWYQGAIADRSYSAFFAERAAECGRHDLVEVIQEATTCFIAVSQTCDIVQLRDDAEPFVEFLLATIHEGPPDAALTHMKSFRRFAVSLASDDRHVLVKPWDRLLVTRADATKVVPSADLYLSRARVQDLVDWLMTRYRRAALPDEFNRRLGTVRAEDKLRKLLTQLPAVTEVFIGLKPRTEELGPQGVYTCEVRLLCPESKFRDNQLLEAMQPTIDAIDELLESIDGIEVEAVRLYGEHQFTRESMRVFDRWQLDDVSFAADAKAEKQGGRSGHEYSLELGRGRKAET